MVPQPFLLLSKLVESRRRLNELDVFIDLKIKELDESKDELVELTANGPTCMKENSASLKKDSTSSNGKS